MPGTFADLALQPGVPEAGDLIFQLSLQEDPSFSLNGLDLLCTCRLTLSEALLGFDRTVLTHLDGRQIRVERRAGTITRPGDVQRVRGEGMMTQGDRGERGDLYIRVSGASRRRHDRADAAPAVGDRLSARQLPLRCGLACASQVALYCREQR